MHSAEKTNGCALSLSVQYGQEGEEEPPSRARVRSLLRAALPRGGEVGVRFVGAREAAHLNKTYRCKTGATNALAFSYDCESGRVCGDIVVCVPLVAREAKEAGVAVSERYAQVLVHAALHLAGYGHEATAAAAEMEKAEYAVLRRFGFAAARPV